MNDITIAVPLEPDGNVGHSWGKACVVAVARVDDGDIVDWAAHEVGWDALHDEGEHGTHHARIARFVREHQVDHVIARHMGANMQNMLGKLGITISQPVVENARTAVVALGR